MNEFAWGFLIGGAVFWFWANYRYHYEMEVWLSSERQRDIRFHKTKTDSQYTAACQEADRERKRIKESRNKQRKKIVAEGKLARQKAVEEIDKLKAENLYH
jgi:hypothetical protein